MATPYKWRHGDGRKKWINRRNWGDDMVRLFLNETPKTSRCLPSWWGCRDYVIKSLTSLPSLCSWHHLRQPYVAPADTRARIRLQTRTLASARAFSKIQTQTSGALRRRTEEELRNALPLGERPALKWSGDPGPMALFLKKALMFGEELLRLEYCTVDNILILFTLQ